MRMRVFRSAFRCERGAVLIVALIFLLLLALVATTVIQNSELEFKMAGNAQFREEAFQRAQAIVTAIASDVDNFPVVGEVGYTICPTGCDANMTALTGDVVSVPTGVTLDYRVVREGPMILESLPFRQAEGVTSSVTSYDAAVFEVQASYEGGDVRLGNAEVAQGVAVKIVASTQ